MNNNTEKTKIAVALSGGLDSSVTCWLLKEQGYEVVAITVKMVNDEKFEQIIQNAKEVAKQLGIEHYTLDLHEQFKQDVIDYFENSYKNGQTPNPCILCNRTIKWGALFDYATKELNCNFVASGHYAKICNENGVLKLNPAKDETKDQQYYLFELTQDKLKKILFPLADYTKDEIRKIAIENNLPSKSAKESQDICFITKPMTTKKYLIEKFGEIKGNFVLENTGEKIGSHNGFYQYTIGQRKGIGIAYKEPLYVTRLDANKNIVYVGTKEYLYKNSLKIKNITIQYPIKNDEFDAFVKIRYNMQPQKAKIKINKDESTGEIIFFEAISSITSGQAAVFYDIDNKHLIGGGWII
jgi:tRNA-specific 2-thiouridylase